MGPALRFNPLEARGISAAIGARDNAKSSGGQFVCAEVYVWDVCNQVIVKVVALDIPVGHTMSILHNAISPVHNARGIVQANRMVVGNANLDGDKANLMHDVTKTLCNAACKIE
jgi:hypothetical protein